MLAYIPYMDPMGYDIYILKKKNKTNKAKSTEIGDRKVTANNYRKTRVWSTGHLFMSTWGFYVHLEMVMINPVDSWRTGDWRPFANWKITGGMGK